MIEFKYNILCPRDGRSLNEVGYLETSKIHFALEVPYQRAPALVWKMEPPNGVGARQNEAKGTFVRLGLDDDILTLSMRDIDRDSFIRRLVAASDTFRPVFSTIGKNLLRGTINAANIKAIHPSTPAAKVFFSSRLPNAEREQTYAPNTNTWSSVALVRPTDVETYNCLRPAAVFKQGAHYVNRHS